MNGRPELSLYNEKYSQKIMPEIRFLFLGKGDVCTCSRIIENRGAVKTGQDSFTVEEDYKQADFCTVIRAVSEDR